MLIIFQKKELAVYARTLSDKKHKYLVKFKNELVSGIAYYRQLFSSIMTGQKQKVIDLLEQLYLAEENLNTIFL